MLHNDKKVRKDIQQQVIRKVLECQRKATKIIVLGDFNDIICNNLDQSRKDSKRTQKLPLLNWLGIQIWWTHSESCTHMKRNSPDRMIKSNLESTIFGFQKV